MSAASRLTGVRVTSCPATLTKPWSAPLKKCGT
jgi:hypothetical protein